MKCSHLEKQIIRINDAVRLPFPTEEISSVVRYGLRRQGTQLVTLCFVRRGNLDYGYPLQDLEKA